LLLSYAAPLTGGILVTYTSWRVIYGLQAGMTLLGLSLAYCYIPKDAGSSSGTVSAPDSNIRFRKIIELFNPLPVVQILRYPEILLSVSQLNRCFGRHLSLALIN
jgi:hypothetical protein